MTERITLAPYAHLTRDIAYPVAVLALKHWAQKDLSCAVEANGAIHFGFDFKGSTCTNGGTEFAVRLHFLLEPAKHGLMVHSGWIDYEESEEPVLRKMCDWPKAGQPGHHVMGMPRQLIGKTLEQAIGHKMPVNPAGCLCTEPMRNIKWLWALSAVHYAVREGMEVRGMAAV